MFTILDIRSSQEPKFGVLRKLFKTFKGFSFLHNDRHSVKILHRSFTLYVLVLAYFYGKQSLPYLWKDIFQNLC